MNAEQKRAWVILGVGILSTAGYLVLVPFVGAWASVAFGLYGLLFLVPFIGGKQPVDERDRSISFRATMAGGMSSYLAFLLACQCAWWIIFVWRGRELVSIHIVQLITAFGVVIFFSIRSILIIVLYRRHMEAFDA